MATTTQLFSDEYINEIIAWRPGENVSYEEQEKNLIANERIAMQAARDSGQINTKSLIIKTAKEYIIRILKLNKGKPDGRDKNKTSEELGYELKPFFLQKKIDDERDTKKKENLEKKLEELNKKKKDFTMLKEQKKVLEARQKTADAVKIGTQFKKIINDLKDLNKEKFNNGLNEFLDHIKNEDKDRDHIIFAALTMILMYSQQVGDEFNIDNQNVKNLLKELTIYLETKPKTKKREGGYKRKKGTKKKRSRKKGTRKKGTRKKRRK
tara:strand:- start:877 stop:1677 length:801 start_codon:yes stop_codon:yes gene_type:complete